MIDLNKLAAELHEAAVVKGFWDVDDAVDKHLAKMHSELSEAIQEERCCGLMMYVDDITIEGPVSDPEMFDGRKPEGVAVELADFVMMALDFFVYSDLDLNAAILPAREVFRSKMRKEYIDMQLPRLVLLCHEAVVKIVSQEDFNALRAAISMCIFGVELWLDTRGVNLWDVIALKATYNKKSRSKLHGRKY